MAFFLLRRTRAKVAKFYKIHAAFFPARRGDAACASSLPQARYFALTLPRKLFNQMRTIQFREALREAMSEEMRRDPSIFLMGE
ncbi:MAG: hypothetical protein EOO36_01145, partial [Cytophagaceae bacterium]